MTSLEFKRAVRPQIGLFIISILLLGPLACKKEDSSEANEQANTASSKDHSLSDKMMSDVFGQIDAAIRQEDSIKAGSYVPNCASVTIDASSNPTPSNPNEIWVDYGKGCTDSAGVTRSGVIYAKLTGRYRDSLTEIIVRPKNYTVNGYSVEGVKRVTNKGHNSDGNLWYTVEVDSVKITAPNGSWSSTWESDRTREWIQGEGSVWWPFDDVYLIDGTAQGTNRNGKDYEVEITTPLRVEIGCPWLTEGHLEVRPDGLSTRTVDYGDGQCDSKATVTVNGKAYQILVN